MSAEDEPHDVPADERRPPADSSPTPAKAGLAALTLGALGVVFGDIGTSPLYAMKETFSTEHGLKPDPTAVYGVLSLIFWAITIVVTCKYVLFIMRADNEGEGGVMALISLIRRSRLDTPRAKWLLIAMGAFGAALFYGDGMITPAISVMSAVEGLEVVTPSLETFVVPATLVILSTLFFVQRFGTGPLGRFFGPIMAAWFGSLAVFGLIKTLGDPSVVKALSPTYGVEFFTEHGGQAFLALGSVVLAITGAEALYADMGHFGPGPIRRAWFVLVLPALFLNYLGQGALLLSDPKAIENPFFMLVPDWALIPMVILATSATVIASQAVISGAFSVTRQAVQLGFLPLLTIRHTSKQAIGQIYVPAVNWSLFVAIVALVVGFGSSTALASAYGIAVTGTLAIDTVLAFVVVRALWHKPLWLAISGATAFLFVDLAFFAANVPKIPTGGWFPLLVGLGVFTILMTWRRGRDIVSTRRTEEEGPLLDFVKELQASDDPPTRVRGTAIFLNAQADTTPLAMRYNVEHNHVLHELNVVVYVEAVGVPYVSDEDRIEVDDLAIPDDGISLVVVRFGFQDEPNVPRALRHAECDGSPIDLGRATYFLSRITVSPGDERTMMAWRKRLFSLMTRNSASRWAYFDLPEDRVVAFGSNIEV
ncbi:MAG TPA: potassium transporter Kup [Thermoleophilaceae bacterium]|nr:potassium transporter Kup [Thermoleophilaceae bacterium]